MRRLTIAIMIAVVAFSAVYDIVAFAIAGTDATISKILFDGAQRAPILAFALGVLAGHWFWPLKR